jgi:hypothetical protein
MLARTRSFALLLLGGTIPVVACLEPAVIGATKNDGVSATDTTEANTVSVTGTSMTVTAGGAFTLATWNTQHVADCEGTCPEDLLWLVFDSDGASCEAPADVPQQDHSAWRVSIGLPPSRVAVGTYLTGDDPDVEVETNETFVTDSSATGGGGVTNCRLEILSVDAQSLLASITGCTLNFPSDGTYELPRCAPVTLPPEAIALNGSDLGGEGGGEPDPNAVVLVVGDTVAACGDDPTTACEDGAFRVAIALPAAFVAVGTHDLGDSQVVATDCGEPLSLAGTIDVLAVDDTSMIVRLSSTNVPSAVRDQELRIQRCP